MSKRPKTIFQKHCLAVAIAALTVVPSACSTLPGASDRTSPSTQPVARADAGETGTWGRLMYLLGFSEEARRDTRLDRSRLDDRLDERLAETRPQPASGLLDEVDPALMESGAMTPVPDLAIGSPETDRAPTGLDGDSSQLTQALVDDQDLRVGSRDLIHEVRPTETLWDIAKATTGDATNWHVLADVNDLAPDASVYPGQTLTIPADLVRPELASGRLGEGLDSGESLDAQSSLAATADGIGDDALAETAPVETALADQPVVELELESGETLWDFAKRTTGNANHWIAISDVNGFTARQARRVYPGQSIRVPAELVRDSLAADASERALPALDAVATDTAGDIVDETLRGDSATLASAMPGTDTAEVRVASAPSASTDAMAEETTRIVEVEAAYRDEEIRSLDLLDEENTEETVIDLPTEIMVSGTYYPKAVYNDADFSSSLLMRVSPGTTLQVSRAVGPWFEVLTEQGRGYVHTRDIK